MEMKLCYLMLSLDHTVKYFKLVEIRTYWCGLYVLSCYKNSFHFNYTWKYWMDSDRPVM